MAWKSLEEAASSLGKSLRTAYRMLEDGRLIETSTDAGPLFSLADGTTDADGNDDNDVANGRDVTNVSMTMAQDGEPSEAAARPRGRPSGLSPGSAAAVKEAKARAVLHSLAGPPYLAVIDAAEALDALDEAARAQVDAEALLSMCDPDDGQAGYDGWRRLADAIASALRDVDSMLERRVVDDARLAALDRTFRRIERKWAAAREYDVTHAPGGAAAVAAVRRRVQREARLFGAATEALRRALIE